MTGKDSCIDGSATTLVCNCSVCLLEARKPAGAKEDILQDSKALHGLLQMEATNAEGQALAANIKKAIDIHVQEVADEYDCFDAQIQLLGQMPVLILAEMILHFKNYFADYAASHRLLIEMTLHFSRFFCGISDSMGIVHGFQKIFNEAVDMKDKAESVSGRLREIARIKTGEAGRLFDRLGEEFLIHRDVLGKAWALLDKTEQKIRMQQFDRNWQGSTGIPPLESFWNKAKDRCRLIVICQLKMLQAGQQYDLFDIVYKDTVSSLQPQLPDINIQFAGNAKRECSFVPESSRQILDEAWTRQGRILEAGIDRLVVLQKSDDLLDESLVRRLNECHQYCADLKKTYSDMRDATLRKDYVTEARLAIQVADRTEMLELFLREFENVRNQIERYVAKHAAEKIPPLVQGLKVARQPVVPKPDYSVVSADSEVSQQHSRVRLQPQCDVFARQDSAMPARQDGVSVRAFPATKHVWLAGGVLVALSVALIFACPAMIGGAGILLMAKLGVGGCAFVSATAGMAGMLGARYLIVNALSGNRHHLMNGSVEACVQPAVPMMAESAFEKNDRFVASGEEKNPCVSEPVMCLPHAMDAVSAAPPPPPPPAPPVPFVPAHEKRPAVTARPFWGSRGRMTDAGKAGVTQKAMAAAPSLPEELAGRLVKSSFGLKAVNKTASIKKTPGSAGMFGISPMDLENKRALLRHVRAEERVSKESVPCGDHDGLRDLIDKRRRFIRDDSPVSTISPVW